MHSYLYLCSRIYQSDGKNEKQKSWNGESSQWIIPSCFGAYLFLVQPTFVFPFMLPKMMKKGFCLLLVLAALTYSPVSGNTGSADSWDAMGKWQRSDFEPEGIQMSNSIKAS